MGVKDPQNQLSPAMRRLQRLVCAVREYRQCPTTTATNRLNNEIAIAEKLIDDAAKQMRLFDEPPD